MRVCGLSHFYRQDIQTPVPHPRLRDRRIGETLYPIALPAQYHGFHTIVMIQVHMQGGNDQVVMLVLRPGQATGQFPFVMVVHVCQVGHAISAGGLFQMFAPQSLPNQVADRLGAIPVTSAGHELLECLDQLIVQGDGESLHRDSSFALVVLKESLLGHPYRWSVNGRISMI
jgi:hypothetical protein